MDLFDPLLYSPHLSVKHAQSEIHTVIKAQQSSFYCLFVYLITSTFFSALVTQDADQH